MQKINLQEPQRKRNATANLVNLIRTSTVAVNTTPSSTLVTALTAIPVDVSAHPANFIYIETRISLSCHVSFIK